MPTYDYRCRSCGHTIEIIHSILDEGPETCERCRGPMMRVLHPAGVIFRGSGFYVTDSRAAGRNAAKPSSGSSAGDGGSGATGEGGATKAGGKTDGSAPPSGGGGD